MLYALCLRNDGEHDPEGRLIFFRLYLHLPPHLFDQSGGDVKSSTFSITHEEPVSIFLSDLTGIRDLGDGPPISSIRPDAEFSSFLWDSIERIVEQVVQNPLDMERKTPNPQGRCQFAFEEMNVLSLQFTNGLLIDQEPSLQLLCQVYGFFPPFPVEGQGQFLDTGGFFQDDFQGLINLLLFDKVFSILQDLLQPLGKTGCSNF